ncbi:MAG: sigma-54 dependent transcriptional regulator [Planctomycetota bacterium]
MKRRVLVVDDDPTILEVVQLCLEEIDVEATTVGTASAALQALSGELPDAVILDVVLPDVSGVDVLDHVRKRSARLPVVMMTADDEVRTAVECMRRGATDFVQKPFVPARLATTVSNAMRQGVLSSKLEAVCEERRREAGFETLLGESQSLQKVKELLVKAVGTDVTILIEGESGTGKEVLARAIHAESERSASPFVPVNCGAIPDALIEAELFGHERGAFTGADSARPGLFEQASGGTIFLDEIGELRADLQVRLLRVLQERVIRRVGSTSERPVDVRVIAATNRDLQAEVAEGRFREDLFYRLAVFPVALPPLRERGADVVLLAEHFLAGCASGQGKHVVGLSSEAEGALRSYHWPGNVRQLQNVIERAVILTEGYEVGLADLSDDVVCHVYGDRELASSASESVPSLPSVGGTRVVPLAEVERATIEHALRVTGWNVKDAAERLEIGRATLYRRIHQYGLVREAADPQSSLGPDGAKDIAS